jgi:cation diffusion facilitator family transporter
MFNRYTNEQLIRYVTVLAIIVNLVLTTLKLVIGFLIGSTALLADGIDSFLDIMTTIFAYIGVRIASKPPDINHPYGHQKMEVFFSLGIFGFIAYSCVQIFLNALDKIISQQIFVFEISGLITAIFSICLKLVLAYSVLGVGKKVNSPALIANAKNFRTDVLSSVLVAVSMIFAYFNLGLLDPVIAIIICIFIAYTGLTIFIEGWDILVDKAPPNSVLKAIEKIAMDVEGVREVHLIRARYLQQGIIGDMHILVDPMLTVLEGHRISEVVASRLKEELKVSMIVHLEPFTPDQSLLTSE